MKTQTYQLPDTVANALARSENFRVQTMDGTGWINPFSGEIVPAPFGWEEVARRHLLQTKPWLANKKPKTLRELLLLRWVQYLRDNLQFMPTLRIFRQGLWLNPYTGKWLGGVKLVNNQVTQRVAEQLAQILSGCPEAQTGKMLEKSQLETLAAQGPGETHVVAQPLSGPIAKPLSPKFAKASSKSSGSLAVPKAKPPVARPVPEPRSRDDRNATDFHQLRRMFAKMLAKPPRVDHQQIVLHYEPHAPIARDFYDFIKVGPKHLLIVLGNFNGRGPGAALMAGTALQGLRTCAQGFSSLEEYVARLNDEIRCDLYHGSSIALYTALIDLDRNVMTCLSAGHRPLLHISPHAQSVISQVRTNGASLGVLTGDLFRQSLESETITLADGDIVLFVSDGVFKTVNPGDPEAGRCTILGKILADLDKPLAKLLKDVLDEARAHVKAPVEDMTMVAIRAKDTPWLFKIAED